MKKKAGIFLIALMIVFVMATQTAMADGTNRFSERPVITTVTTGETSVKVSWKNVKGAAGYEIYRALPGRQFKKIKTMKSGKVLQYTDHGLKRNTSYYYRIKAYRLVDGRKYYGRYSWSKSGNAGIPQELRGFRTYTSDKETISMGWYQPDGTQGVLIYRSNYKDGAYKRIAKAEAEDSGPASYDDSAVKPGRTYYYKARPYIDYKGKLIKGKMTKASSKTAMHYNPKADVTIEGVSRDGTELIFKVVMKDYSFDTEFFIIEEEGSELGTITLRQQWNFGSAEETRQTLMKITGLGTDGVDFQGSGKVKVKQGETIYIKAEAGEPVYFIEGEALDCDIYCHYNGKYSRIGLRDE